MFLLILFALFSAVVAGTHNITVRGSFLCDRNHKLPVFVELMEHDTFTDDRLKWLQTKVLEYFEITGSEDEYFGIKPYLRVMHSCRGFDETLIINLGKRNGQVNIDLGDIDLQDPNTITEIRDKYVA